MSTEIKTALGMAAAGELKNSVVQGQTSQGAEIHAMLVRLARFSAVFEIYSPGIVLRTSEVLTDFKITTQGRVIYSGRAVVNHLINAGTAIICEVALADSWVEGEGHQPQIDPLRELGFKDFLDQWQKIYRLKPEFKVVVADMHAFLTDLRLWLEQMEVSIRSSPSAERAGLEKRVAAELAPHTTAALTTLFEKFEEALAGVEEEFKSAHRVFARRQLHPLLLCSPFLYRTFAKPLGYAGDYEMVNMILRDPFEGGSLYAKIVNYWFLQQAPAEAHRNRVAYLTEQLEDCALRLVGSGRPARVLNLGCGPAHEIQKLLRESPLAEKVQLLLLDFNAETISHTQFTLENARRQHQRSTQIRFAKRSVNQILKEAGKSAHHRPDDQYDLVYCAGLYDYLVDPVCQKLTNILYGWVAPGGLLITTNVDPSNPRKVTMEYIMEWHLIYRSGAQLRALKPELAPGDVCSVKSDTTGVNVYFEARKPKRD